MAGSGAGSCREGFVVWDFHVAVNPSPEKMKPVRKVVGWMAAMACSSLASGHAALNVDGILVVKRLPLEGARMIVVSKEGDAEMRTDGLAHFTLPMELGRTYLLSFERPGCISKQLLFNTAVPEAARRPSGFTFPFQVTLEPARAGERMQYAGPVGFIHFDEQTGEFAFSTDYRIAKDDALVARLEQVRDEHPGDEAVPSVLPVDAAGTGGVVSGLAAPGNVPAVEGRLAPTVGRVAPMVHVMESTVQPAAVGALDMRSDLLWVPPMAMPAGELVKTSVADRAVANAEAPARVGVHVVNEELETDRLHVITTITVKGEEGTSVYRRVAGYYGGVTFFRDGYPCSEFSYREGTGR